LAFIRRDPSHPGLFKRRSRRSNNWTTGARYEIRCNRQQLLDAHHEPPLRKSTGARPVGGGKSGVRAAETNLRYSTIQAPTTALSDPPTEVGDAVSSIMNMEARRL